MESILSRLTDRIESDETGDHVIKRYGLWGITDEVEQRGKGKYVVIQKNKKEKQFKTLAEAEVYMKELFDHR